MSDPPLVPQPPEAPGEWDSLSFGAPGPPSPRRRTLVVGLVAAGVLVVVGTGLGTSVLGGPGSPTAPASSASASRSSSAVPQPPRSVPRSGPVPHPTVPPTGLGIDPTFDQLARQCYGGLMHACDELYDVSAPRSRYEAFADTCAGRQRRDTNLYCTESFPGP